MHEEQSLSPLMKQYWEVKNKFPYALLLFQVGDFYEMFYEDAQKASAFLGITLTKRTQGNNQDVPLCGVPMHAIDHYLIKLVKGGFRVVLCDQVGKPQPGRLVERSVSQVLTPGTLTDMRMLQEKSASYSAVVVPIGDCWALVFLELLTGQLCATILSASEQKLLDAELSRFVPDEIIITATKQGKQLEQQMKSAGYVVTIWDRPLDFMRDNQQYRQWLKKQFSEAITSFVIRSEALCTALGILYDYLLTHFPRSLEQCKQLMIYSPDDFLILDAATQRNLELLKNLQDNTASHTLIEVLDQACTSMGSRQLKKWLLRPLVKKELIEQRLDVVELFRAYTVFREEVITILKSIGDLERMIGRIALSRAQMYDFLGLKKAVEQLPQLIELLERESSCVLLVTLTSRLSKFDSLYQLLDRSLNDDPDKEWLIKSAYSEELDRLRVLVEDGTKLIIDLEQRELANTGLSTLKIRFSKTQGYAFEVSKNQAEQLPPYFVRLQTLANRERFTTDELRTIEYDIQQAHNQISGVEQEIFSAICALVLKEIPALKKTAQALAHLDALISFALCAYQYNYTRPQFTETRDMIIKEGRHPVVERSNNHNFIPNNLSLTDQEKLWIITGPNMGGKSTFLRQVALISIMAQSGSFVPAHTAQLPIFDRIFTRIGAADNVAAGKSTFLVEMEETALICNHATQASLVILDEVGRGTSTYDGLALAQAIVEYIYTTLQARCLFATHYHELTGLISNYPGIAVYHAASKETPEGVLLLHKIVPGAAKGSFGLEVAKRARLPNIVIERAQSILSSMGK